MFFSLFFEKLRLQDVKWRIIVRRSVIAGWQSKKLFDEVKLPLLVSSAVGLRCGGIYEVGLRGQLRCGFRRATKKGGFRFLFLLLSCFIYIFVLTPSPFSADSNAASITFITRSACSGFIVSSALPSMASMNWSYTTVKESTIS